MTFRPFAIVDTAAETAVVVEGENIIHFNPSRSLPFGAAMVNVMAVTQKLLSGKNSLTTQS